MSTDFRARSIRVNQIINSGSTSTSPLLIYGLGSATDTSGGYTVDHFTTGSDTWLFISGSSGARGTSTRGVVTFKGDVVVSGSLYAAGGITGSLTKLADGTNYLRPGSNITLTTGSDGSVTVASTGGGGGTPGGSNTQVQFNNDGSFLGTSGLTFATGTNSLTVTGDLAVNGGDVTSTATTFNLLNSTVTTLNIGGASNNTTIGASTGKVIIPGDLQVQGTTTTISSSNLTVRDSLIGLGYLSGTVAESSTGDRGFVGGYTTANSNVAFIWSNNSSSFIAGKTGNLPNSSSIYVTNYQPIRASSFQVNGTTAVITSSNGSTLTLSGTAVVLNASGSGRTTLQEDGNNFIEFSRQSDGYSAQIRSIETSYPSLYLSGNFVYLDSYSGTTWFNSDSSGGLAVDTSSPTHPKIFSKEGSGTTQQLTISGSVLNLGSSAGQIKLVQDSSVYLQATYNGASDVVVSAQNYNVNIGSTASTAISGSSVTINHGAGVINLQKHSVNFATFSSGSGDLVSLTAATGKQFQIGGTGLTKISGSLVGVGAGSSGIGFEKDNSQFLTLLSGSGQNATISAYSNNSLTLTSTSAVSISGSSVQVTGSLIAQRITGSITKLIDGTDYLRPGSNITLTTGSDGSVTIASTGGSGSPAGSNTYLQFNADGSFGATSGLTFATGSSSLTIAGDLAVNGGDITSTQSSATIFATSVSSLAIGGAASSISLGNSSNANGFTLNVAASRTGSINVNLATGATISGLTKNINIGQGGDPGSTTNIKLGTTDTAATTNIYVSGSSYVTGSVSIKGSIVPDANTTYTLGTDALRWAHVYTGDLHLRNERGDWTVIEEVDFLRIVNNKTGKNFKMLMQPIDD